MESAKRLEKIHEYYFSAKLREIEALNKEGKQVLNLGIGSPDLPPHPAVIKVLHEEALKPQSHGYQSYKGCEVLRVAVADFYYKQFGVSLNVDTDILPLIGSKEGIMHICMAFLNDGDGALVPDPGYPTYSAAVALSGGLPYGYRLHPEKNWEPDFSELESALHGNIRLMFINYPQMPTGATATSTLLEKYVAFAKKHDIILVHDNAYSLVLNPEPLSIFNIAGAYDIAIELNSVSKSHNMAGWRVGMLLGAPRFLDNVLRFKSNMDSGMFLPVQLAAAKALSLQADWFDWLNAIYKRRKEKAMQLLDFFGADYATNQAGMFMWAKVPKRYKDGFAMSDDILYRASVFITPGGIFGPSAEGYIRISLCNSEERMAEALDRIKNNLK